MVASSRIYWETLFNLGYAKHHLKPIILLFLPQIAISLYVTLDRTMLGALASTKDVGIYDQALKLISMLLTLVPLWGVLCYRGYPIYWQREIIKLLIRCMRYPS